MTTIDGRNIVFFNIMCYNKLMTSTDPIPSRDPENEARESARRLHDSLTAPFERPFESLGYQAEFTYTPSANDAIFSEDGSWSTIGKATGLKPAAMQPWSVELGYDPKKERITTTAVEIPVVGINPQEKLVLQRIETGEYLLLHRVDDESDLKLFATQSDEFEKVIFNRNSATSTSEGYVDKLLTSAGYVAPELFTSPNDLQAHVAETLGTATKWHRKEVIEMPVDDATTVKLERTSSVRPTTHFEEANEEYIKEIDGSITMIIEYHNPESRGQLVIVFSYSDHFVSMPTITTRKVVPAFDASIIANYGPDAVQIIDSHPVELTAEQTDELAEQLTMLLLN